jgi:hypothetical protein
MPWRVVRVTWITLCNLTFISMIGINLLQDHEMSLFQGATRSSNGGFGRFVLLSLVVLLLSGIVADWLGWLTTASTLNVGFFALVGFTVLGKALLMFITKAPTEYDPEAGLAVAVIGMPSAVIAAVDLALYRISKRGTPKGQEM